MAGRVFGGLLLVLAGGLLPLQPLQAANEAQPTPTLTRLPTPDPTPTATPGEQATEPAPAEAAEPEPPGAIEAPAVYPLAVMVDNFPAARPQTGLGAADIVYEALAEGGITRFLAIYTGDSPDRVGPVRSARHYYVYWAAEYNAPVVHVMASDEGYAALVNTGLPDLDEHRGDPGFQRSSDRPMPYNTYISPLFSRQILAANSALWPGSLGGLERRPPSGRLRGAAAGSLQVGYPPGDYEVGWAFDPARRRYLRSQAGGPHVDAASGERIEAVNVVVQFIPTWQYEFREGYLDMELTGAGRAVYFIDGLAIEGGWHRPSLGDYTRYLGPAGRAISFRPGPIWVQVVPTGPLEGTLSYGGSGALGCAAEVAAEASACVPAEPIEGDS